MSLLRRFSPLAAASLAALLLAQPVRAQIAPPVPPVAPAPPPAPRVPGELERFDGVARLYLVNEFGDVEGVVAQDGTPVRFPPHMGADLVQAVKPGDRFVADGRSDGGRGFRAYSIGRPGATPLTEARPSATAKPPLPPEARASSLTAMRVDGTVQSVLYAPRGEVDGVVLGDGTIVRLPARNGVVDAATLRPGAKLSVTGYGTRNAYGRGLHAEMVGVDGQPLVALQPSGPAAPRPPRDPAGRGAQPVPRPAAPSPPAGRGDD